MSPRRPRRTTGQTRFPRVSGDEPDTVALVATELVFSPRERG